MGLGTNRGGRLYCCEELDQLLRYFFLWCVGLLRDTIILDTVCLSEAAKRVTPKDRHILHTLLSKVGLAISDKKLVRGRRN